MPRGSKMSRSKAGSPQFTNFMDRMKQMPERIKKAPPTTIGKTGLGLLLGGVGFGWVAFPFILSFAVSQIVNLQEGGDIRRIWKNLPQAFTFNVYLFNITNPDEVQNGAVPILKEIGPYVYKEWKVKVELVDDTATDEVTYSPMNTWYFQQEASYPLTGDEIITMPHLPIMSTILVAEADFPAPILTVVDAAIPKLYGQLKSIFQTAKARDFLFDGIPIDCTKKDFISRTVCVAVKQNSRPLAKVGKNKYLFSFLGPRNNTPESKRITVKRGVTDTYSIGKIVKINGKPYNTVWKGDDCNTLLGTDATIFPPFRKPDNLSIIAYANDICRTIMGTYEGEGEYQGVKGYKYVVNLGDMAKNSKDKCYCPSEDFCYKKGTVDLTKCQGAPLIGTLPHFYQADESYLNGVVGLKPIKEKHELTLLVEPISGVPLIARIRFQFNLPFHPVRHINLTRKLKSTLLPLIWVEENLDLGEELMTFLSAKLLTNLKLVDIVKWTMIVMGAGICVAGVVKHQKNKMDKAKVTPTGSEAGSQAGSREELIPSGLSASSGKDSEIIMTPEGLATMRGVRRTPAELHPHVPTPTVTDLEKRLFGSDTPPQPSESQPPKTPSTRDK